ncbi:MAG: acyl carrier protein [Bacilli bacterium]|nr:acyl carrier protein [Bacilli bacterium]
MDYVSTIKSILSKRVNVSSLKETDSLTSLGLDSLDLVEVMLEIEEALHIEFSSDEISDLKTLQDVANLIEKKIK